MFDKIYTIGCFDWFHHGHEKLLTRLKKHGKQLIVGIHDDHSLEQLKNLNSEDHQDIKTRMSNVKKYADVVFVIPDKDPTHWIKCIVSDSDNSTNSCYIRGNDMPFFPAREFVETKMSIMFLEYTQGVSSTEIRKQHKKN